MLARSLLKLSPLFLITLLTIPLAPGCQCDDDKGKDSGGKGKLSKDVDDDGDGALKDGQSLAETPPDEPPTLPKANIAAGQEAWTSLSSCYTPDCKLTIHFSQPMIHDVNGASMPSISISPKAAGGWKWKDTSNLVFTPQKNALGYGTAYEIDLSKIAFDHDKDDETPPRVSNHRTFFGRVPYLKIGMKVAYWPVKKDAPRIVLASHVWTGKIGRAPLVVGYDQPVDVDLQKMKISITQDGSDAVTFDVRRPKKDEYAFEPGVAAEHFIAIVLTKKPEEGAMLHYNLPSFATDTEESTDTFILDHSSKFDVANFSTDGGNVRKVPLWGGVKIQFTTPVSLSRAKASFSIEPKPKNLTLTAWSESLNVTGGFARGTEYTITFDKAFKDALGNPLELSDDSPALVFRTRDAPPRLTLPAGPVVLEAGHDKFMLRAINVGAITVDKARISDPKAFAAALGKRRLSNCNIRGTDAGDAPQSVTPKMKLNEKGMVSADFDDTGLFCVTISTLGRGSQANDKAMRRSTLAQVTSLAVVAKLSAATPASAKDEVFAWVTTIKDAKPVEGAKVEVLSKNGKRLGRGSTRADGTVRVAINSGKIDLNKQFFVVVSRGKDDVSVSQVSLTRMTSPWQFGMVSPARTPRLRGALFSERGVYRPGEKVHLKFIGHPDVVNGGDSSITLSVSDSRGRKVSSKEMTLDAFHSANHSFSISKEGNVGRYSVLAKVGKSTTTASFRVEEYRVPTFEVRMTSEQKKWRRSSDIEVMVESRYMHGARMPGREVSYTVTREPIPFTSKAFPMHSFRVVGAELSPSVVMQKKTRLDGMGQKSVRFVANHPAHVGAMRYVIDANVVDVDRQSYSGRIAKTVHAARFYVGVLAPTREVVGTGETITADFAAVFTDGRAMSGAKLKARLERIDNHQTARLMGGDEDEFDGEHEDEFDGEHEERVEIENHEVEKVSATCDVVTRKGRATCKFKVKSPGQYRVRVWARDKDGRDVQAGYSFYASGNGRAAWPRYERARIELIADKTEYKPGDVAKLILQSPFAKATGLLTLEVAGVRTSRLIEIDNNTPAIEVPITDAMAPNVFATVVITRGREHDDKDATGFETGAPSFRMGVANLVVRPDAARLAVTVAPHHRAARPGQKVAIDINVKDASGQAVQGQVTLMVVDEAVLGMTRYKTPDPVNAIFAARGWGVRTFASLTDFPNSRRARKEAMFPGGDGGEGISIADFPAELRKLFDSTALFVPSLKTDKDGKATAEVTFPDNLTTYRIMAIVVDKTGRSGKTDKRITVRKPLMVQPVIPRFLYPGDTLKVEALVVNGSDDEGEVEVTAKVTGATLSGDAKITGRSLEHGQESLFSYSVNVPETLVARKGTVVTVRFAGKIRTKGGKTFTDVVEKKIPVYSPGTKRSVVTSLVFSGTQDLKAKIPADRVEGSLAVEVVASSTMLSELKDAVGYLLGYPNGCIEQTTSMAYPLVLLEDLLPEIGVEVDRAELKKFRDAGIKRILSFQTTKGGLSYWPGEDKPHAFGTAFGLTVLLEAKKKGESIPADKLARMAKFLEDTLRKKDVTETIAHGGIADADSRALFIMTLGRMGRPQHAHVATLWSNKEKLGPFGLSFLATAIREGSGDKELLAPVLAAIRGHAEVKEAEAFFEGKRKGGYSMDSPLRSHAGALLAYATAAPADPMTAKLLKGLLARRRGGMWGNTQENVFGMMAIAKLASQKSAGSEGEGPTIKIGGKTYRGENLDNVSKRVKRILVKGKKTGVSENAAATATAQVSVGSPSYVTLRASWEAALNEENRKPRSHGFRIKREYETPSGGKVDPKSIALGSVVRIRLTVTTDKKRNYVAIDDKLPAGLEPMNMSLATTEKVSLGKMTDERKNAERLLSFHEMRDHRVAFYADELPRGTYEYIYLARATTPGHFTRPAAHVEAMYDTEVYADTSIDSVDIR